MNNKDFHNTLLDIFKDQAIKVTIYVARSVSKTDNYDPFRKTGKQVLLQNPYTINALLRKVSGYSKTLQNVGFTESDVIDIVVKTSDKNLVLISRRVELDGVEYYASYDSQGNKFTVTDLPFGFAKIRLFRKQK